VRQDAMGSVICELGDPEAKEHLLLDAHIDEIGLVVTRVDSKGFLHIDRCGGVDRRVLVGSDVWVFGRKKLSGTICCAPGSGGKAPEMDKFYIDTGFSPEKAKELVPVGSRVMVRSRPIRLMGGKMCCKALDNRAGAAALIRTVELLEQSGGKMNCRLTILLSVQEEIGGYGSKTAAFAEEPTQAIVVDAGFGGQPGVAPEKSGELGKGPMIGCSPVLDYDVTLALRRMADENDISWQNDIMGGATGTNADSIANSRGGVRCGLVSIPLRNMHTAAEMVNIQDIEDTALLLAEYALGCGR